MSQFHHFLRSEYSEENIEFWLICELYKHLPQEDLGEESRRIYRLYLAPHSPHEVNCELKLILLSVIHEYMNMKTVVFH